MPLPPSEFWVRLRDALHERGHPSTQMGVARMLKMSQGSVQRWVRGQGLPTLETTVELAAKAGVCVEWLLTARGPKHPVEDKSPAGELAAIFSILTPEAQQEVLKFARYQRTIGFTGDPGKRSEFQWKLVEKTTGKQSAPR